ncbi:MAG: hypothetical protein II935_11380, partial [Bacteroidales bacterium]|nr:hypothetical protein [Bacteroidales bacterium]
NGQGFYKDSKKYKSKMMKKITKVSGCKKKSQNPFDIYPVVYTGSDLGDIYYEKLREYNNDSARAKKDFDDYIVRNMGWLRGSSRGLQNAPEIIVGDNFKQDVLPKFMDEFNASGFEFHVPKGYINKRIRMNFDDGNKKTELSADFLRKGGKYLLKDINMENGLASDVKLKPGKTLELKAINNKDKNAKLAIFRLERPKCDGKSYYIDKKLVAQSINDDGVWVKNSEYDSQSKGTIDTYFILVFDSSKSLLRYEKDKEGNFIRDDNGNLRLITPTGFDEEREAAREMINKITDGAFDSEKNVEEKNSDRK